MEHPPRISIITPSYNQGPFIERTIKSVLSQEYPNLEYIVMDGGSTDETLDILLKYEKQLKWISQKDNGQADAINRGIKLSTGNIIGYLNSDDLYEPGTLDIVARHFLDHPETMWLTGKCRIIDEWDREIRPAITAYKNFLLRHYSYSLLLVTNPISQPATFWRRDAMNECGLFDEYEHLVMDYGYWLKVGKKYPLSVLDRYLAAFRVYATSKTSSSFLTTFKRERHLAKSYSPSSTLNMLHYLSNALIASSYIVLNLLGRLNRRS
jgi:GT2 family glycosyltransferase